VLFQTGRSKNQYSTYGNTNA
jgi:c-di-GMP-binding flagellar brake protein YcgR